jgi:amylosucrase
MHASVASEVLSPSDPGVLPVLRRHPEGDLLELFNVTETWRPFPWDRVADFGWRTVRDALADSVVVPGSDGNLWLAPYAALWLVEA